MILHGRLPKAEALNNCRCSICKRTVQSLPDDIREKALSFGSLFVKHPTDSPIITPTRGHRKRMPPDLSSPTVSTPMPITDGQPSHGDFTPALVTSDQNNDITSSVALVKVDPVETCVPGPPPKKPRKGQLFPSCDDWVAAHPEHCIRMIPYNPLVHFGKVPFMCGLCRGPEWDAQTATSAKKLIQHVTTSGTHLKAFKSSQNIGMLPILDSTPVDCHGYFTSKDTLFVNSAALYEESLRRWVLMRCKLHQAVPPNKKQIKQLNK